MASRKLIVIILLLFGSCISYGADEFDIQVCEAQAADANKIECYSSLNLNPSCDDQEYETRLSCYQKSAEAIQSGILERKRLENDRIAQERQEEARKIAHERQEEARKLANKLKQHSRETAVYGTYNGLNTADPNFDVGGYCLEKERMGGISFEECLGVAAAKIMSQRK